jgi:hypothetical protein
MSLFRIISKHWQVTPVRMEEKKDEMTCYTAEIPKSYQWLLILPKE